MLSFYSFFEHVCLIVFRIWKESKLYISPIFSANPQLLLTCPIDTEKIEPPYCDHSVSLGNDLFQ